VVLSTGWGHRILAENDAPANVDGVLAKPPKLGVMSGDECGRILIVDDESDLVTALCRVLNTRLFDNGSCIRAAGP
jgi:hypothetical protein